MKAFNISLLDNKTKEWLKKQSKVANITDDALTEQLVFAIARQFVNKEKYIADESKKSLLDIAKHSPAFFEWIYNSQTTLLVTCNIGSGEYNVSFIEAILIPTKNEKTAFSELQDATNIEMSDAQAWLLNLPRPSTENMLVYKKQDDLNKNADIPVSEIVMRAKIDYWLATKITDKKRLKKASNDEVQSQKTLDEVTAQHIARSPSIMKYLLRPVSFGDFLRYQFSSFSPAPWSLDCNKEMLTQIVKDPNASSEVLSLIEQRIKNPSWAERFFGLKLANHLTAEEYTNAFNARTTVQQQQQIQQEPQHQEQQQPSTPPRKNGPPQTETPGGKAERKPVLDSPGSVVSGNDDDNDHDDDEDAKERAAFVNDAASSTNGSSGVLGGNTILNSPNVMSSTANGNANNRPNQQQQQTANDSWLKNMFNFKNW